MLMDGKINIVETTIPPKGIYMFNTIPIKNQDILHQERKVNLKFIWKHKTPQIIKASRAKRATQKVSQYLTLSYTAEP
jgi:hypothetical protein